MGGSQGSQSLRGTSSSPTSELSGVTGRVPEGSLRQAGESGRVTRRSGGTYTSVYFSLIVHEPCTIPESFIFESCPGSYLIVGVRVTVENVNNKDSRNGSPVNLSSGHSGSRPSV